MPFSPNPDLPLEVSNLWSGDLAGDRSELGVFRHQNTLNFGLKDPCYSNVSPIFQKNFPNSPDVGSIIGTDNEFLPNPPVLAPSLRTSSFSDSPSCYPSNMGQFTSPSSLVNLNNQYLNNQVVVRDPNNLDQRGKHVYDVSDNFLAGRDTQSILRPRDNLEYEVPNNYLSNVGQFTSPSSLVNFNNQYLNNQVVVHDPDNLDPKGKCVYDVSDNFLAGRDIQSILRPQDNPKYEVPNNYPINNDALLHRFNHDIVPAPPAYLSKPNYQINGVSAQNPLSHPCASQPTGLKTEPQKKRKASENKEWDVNKRSSHRCSECGIAFSTGNALGGHMSYHAKKKKAEAARAEAALQRHFSKMSVNNFKPQ